MGYGFNWHRIVVSMHIAENEANHEQKTERSEGEHFLSVSFSNFELSIMTYLINVYCASISILLSTALHTQFISIDLLSIFRFFAGS